MEIRIPSGHVLLDGRLVSPPNPKGVVLFAHGSGSSRHSSRNVFVATVLEEAGIATILFDLLTAAEAVNRANVFDVGLLAERLLDATRWALGRSELETTSVGYFGASTGAAAALVAAAHVGDAIAAVVSRGGRPDLAGPLLRQVRSPTLLIVGSRDEPVITLNQSALARLGPESRLEIVPGATHLFEEPGTLERAAELARDWFLRYLEPSRRATDRLGYG